MDEQPLGMSWVGVAWEAAKASALPLMLIALVISGISGWHACDESRYRCPEGMVLVRANNLFCAPAPIPR